MGKKGTNYEILDKILNDPETQRRLAQNQGMSQRGNNDGGIWIDPDNVANFDQLLKDLAAIEEQLKN